MGEDLGATEGTMENEVLECVRCHVEVVLQDVAFFEGPGSSWWCRCPSCGELLDPEEARPARPAARPEA